MAQAEYRDGEWYVNGKKLDCRACKHYATDIEVVGDFCRYHHFRFEGNRKTCEDFEYNGPSSSGSEEGCLVGLFKLLLKLVLGICEMFLGLAGLGLISYLILRLFGVIG